MTSSLNGELAIVRVRCRISPECGLRTKMKELAQAGATCVLLDLTEVTELDTASLGELVAGHASVAKAGGCTMLLNVNHRAKELLRIARLGSAFPTYYGAGSVVRGVLANRPRHEREAEPCTLSEVYIS